MTWFAFHNDGHVYDLNGAAEKQLAATGAHGYATEAQALAHRNAPATALQAQFLAGYLTAASSPVGGGMAGVIQVLNTDASGQNTSKVSPVNNPLTSGVAGALSAFFGDTSSNWLLRTAEILLGLALIAVGVAKLTNAVPAATRVAAVLG